MRFGRHKVGEPVERDVIVYEEHDEKFWVGIGLSFDERNLVIGTGSKTTTEVLMLPTATPEGEFQAFIPRQEGVEYDVSFAVFEHAGEHGEDLPVAIVYHNLANPNFEIDVIDMSAARPPYRMRWRAHCAGSPYGSEDGEKVTPARPQCRWARRTTMPRIRRFCAACAGSRWRASRCTSISWRSRTARTDCPARGDVETAGRTGLPRAPPLAIRRGERA